MQARDAGARGPEHAIAEAILRGDREGAASLCERTLARPGGRQRALRAVLSAVEEAGRRYQARRMHLPEMVRTAEAARSCLARLEPGAGGGDREGTDARGRRPTVLIGVVQGDPHDLGKNLVALMLAAGGFQVHDLGYDVSGEAFVEAQRRVRAEVIALSTMMTTTLPAMHETLKLLREESPSAALVIGGASVSQRAVERFGAHATAADAPGALQAVRRLLAAAKEV